MIKNIKNFKQYNESTYSDISKQIGWNKQEVEIPTEKEIKKLIHDAENGDTWAFKLLFKINRFANTPTTDEDIDRLNLAVSGFRKTEHLYR